MGIEKRLARHLKRLNRAIQRLVAQAPEFGELRKMLREEHVELAIYVVPLVGGKPAGEELRFELTDADKDFLKEAGIQF
jgi:branched-subunit amino acid aminotransferase/4-amino-4-deoxychorismate lyase